MCVVIVLQIAVVVLDVTIPYARIAMMIKIQNLKTTIPTDRYGFAVDPVESWLDALMTRPRMVIGKEEYGTPFPSRKHRSLNQLSIIDFRRDFKDACAFDPRLGFDNVEFDLSEASIGVVKFDVYLNIGVISGELVA